MIDLMYYLNTKQLETKDEKAYKNCRERRNALLTLLRRSLSPKELLRRFCIYAITLFSLARRINNL